MAETNSVTWLWGMTLPVVVSHVTHPWVRTGPSSPSLRKDHAGPFPVPKKGASPLPIPKKGSCRPASLSLRKEQAHFPIPKKGAGPLPIPQKGAGPLPIPKKGSSRPTSLSLRKEQAHVQSLRKEQAHVWQLPHPRISVRHAASTFWGMISKLVMHWSWM